MLGASRAASHAGAALAPRPPPILMRGSSVSTALARTPGFQAAWSVQKQQQQQQLSSRRARRGTAVPRASARGGRGKDDDDDDDDDDAPPKTAFNQLEITIK